MNIFLSDGNEILDYLVIGLAELLIVNRVEVLGVVIGIIAVLADKHRLRRVVTPDLLQKG